MSAKVFLAGPEVFLPNSREIGRKKKGICERYGLDALYPGDIEFPDDASTHAIAKQIVRASNQMLREADAVVANLTPFRGPTPDDGTVFEVGQALAMGKLVAGYDCYGGDVVHKVHQLYGGTGRVDREGALIEEFGLPQALLVAMPLIEAQSLFVADKPLPIDDLKMFEKAIAAIANRLARRS